MVQLKIRDRGFHTFTRRRSLSASTDSESVIYEAARTLWTAMDWESVPVRLIGVTVASLTESPAVQGDLFATDLDRRRPRLDRVMDDVHDRFGDHLLGRGRGLLASGIDRTPWGSQQSSASESRSERNPT